MLGNDLCMWYTNQHKNRKWLVYRCFGRRLGYSPSPEAGWGSVGQRPMPMQKRTGEISMSLPKWKMKMEKRIQHGYFGCTRSCAFWIEEGCKKHMGEDDVRLRYYPRTWRHHRLRNSSVRFRTTAREHSEERYNTRRLPVAVHRHTTEGGQNMTKF